MSFYGKMVRDIVDNGEKVKSMGKEHGHHQMVTFMMASGSKERSKVMEYIHRQMVIIFVKFRSAI